MERTVSPVARLSGTISVPPDKSISHRAAILNAVADGSAVVENFLLSADCLATLECLRALGVAWSLRETADGRNDLAIEGRGFDGLRESDDVLDARNSGTTMRLLAGLLAGRPFLSHPDRRRIAPFPPHGAHSCASAGDGRAGLGARRRYPGAAGDTRRASARHPSRFSRGQRSGEVGASPGGPSSGRRDRHRGAGALPRPHGAHAAGHGGPTGRDGRGAAPCAGAQ